MKRQEAETNTQTEKKHKGKHKRQQHRNPVSERDRDCMYVCGSNARGAQYVRAGGKVRVSHAGDPTCTEVAARRGMHRATGTRRDTEQNEFVCVRVYFPLSYVAKRNEQKKKATEGETTPNHQRKTERRVKEIRHFKTRQESNKTRLL